MDSRQRMQQERTGKDGRHNRVWTREVRASKGWRTDRGEERHRMWKREETDGVDTGERWRTEAEKREERRERATGETETGETEERDRKRGQRTFRQ